MAGGTRGREAAGGGRGVAEETLQVGTSSLGLRRAPVPPWTPLSLQAFPRCLFLPDVTGVKAAHSAICLDHPPVDHLEGRALGVSCPGSPVLGFSGLSQVSILLLGRTAGSAGVERCPSKAPRARSLLPLLWRHQTRQAWAGQPS